MSEIKVIIDGQCIGDLPALAAMLSALEAENRLLREQWRWIPVGEQLPQNRQGVLAALTPDRRGRVEVCEAVHDAGSDFSTEKGSYECSHWMPLPLGPEGVA